MVAVIADLVQRGLAAWWAPALAFAAGVVSFASPCVLPLVPGYLTFVVGEQAEAEPSGMRRRLVPIALFVLGFSVVFTVIGGFTAGSLARWLKSPVGQRAAGIVVILFGSFMLLYAFRVGAAWLYREERPFLSKVKPGPAAAFPLGAAFAVGWTPCIGPVLGGILTLAAAQGGTTRAVVLLLFYSIGLGVPFLLLGLGLGSLMGAMRFFSRHYRVFAAVSGSILVVIGVLLTSGAWTRLTAPLFRFINRFTPAI
jgi:cytochrome c-type biogenesis protein